MCGISGAFIKDKEERIDREEMYRIRERMFNRGPDGKGIWFSSNEKVCLAHRRLSIIDPSDNSSQPMMDALNGNVIVFNGEIYNYQNLKNKLENLGHKFRTKSDTEVILILYREYGLKLFIHLKGMFSFALWDEGKKELILARDPIGIKPLYYSNDTKSIKFASQVKALLSGNNINKRLSPAGNVGYFLWGSVPEPYTIFKGIKSIPNGFYFIIDSEGKIIKKKYDSIADRISNIESNSTDLSKKELITQIIDNIDKVVSYHTTSDVPISTFLSAGFDSFIISKLASKYSNLKSFTLDNMNYNESINSEIYYAKLISKKLNFKSFTKEISLNDINNELDLFLSKMDQPTVDGLNIWFVSKLAKENGIKVSLSGLGGDEIFGTYPTFTAIPKILKYCSFFKRNSKSTIIFRDLVRNFIPSSISKKYASIFEFGTDLSAAYFLKRSLFLPWQLLDFMDKNFVEEGLDDLKVIKNLDKNHQNIKSSKLAISTLEINNYMKNTLLKDSDWCGMTNSVEIRVPFADIDLIENLLKLEANKFSKSIIAKEIDSSFPNEFYYRKKTGFDINFASSKAFSKNQKVSKIDNYIWAKKVYYSYLNLNN
tara:strand:- start:25 stop:1818 length:1794 start_codon:yes stop_codon:yes gene_type:complete